MNLSAKYDSNSPKALSLNKLLVEMIAEDLQPLSIIENPGFVNLCKALDPRFQMPSRALVRNKLLPGNSKNNNNNLKKFLSNKIFLQKGSKKSKQSLNWNSLLQNTFA